jgi:hypothetical protein
MPLLVVFVGIAIGVYIVRVILHRNG